MIKRDRLYLLKPDFQDPAFPGQRFYCWHCALLEDVLASFPHLAEALDVERIDWPRPRRAIIDVVGEANQSLPLLLLAGDAPDDLPFRSHEGRRFIADKDDILRALSLRHGFHEPHP